MAIRRKGTMRRRYEMTLELLAAMAGGAAGWIRFWVDEDEARRAFETMRHRVLPSGRPMLQVAPGETYETFLARLDEDFPSDADHDEDRAPVGLWL